MSVTTPSSPLCIDANLVVSLVLPTTSLIGAAVQALWSRWSTERRTFVAPHLLRFELANSIHRLVRANFIGATIGRTALQTALAVPITFITDDDLHLSALDFAARFNLPAAHDSHYLALADRLRTEFWTADEKLFNAVGPSLPWVKLIKGQSPP